VPDGPVALVNGAPVSNQEFKDLYMGEVLRWAQLNPGQEVSDEVRLGIGLNGLRMLIEREILYQEAQKRKLSIPESELEAKWQEELETLRKASSGEGASELTEAVILERAGATRQEALTELRKAMLIEKVRDAIMKEKGVNVSDQEVKDWYSQNRDVTRRPDMMHLKQIFIQGDKTRKDKQDEAARKRAEDAYKRILAGQSFEGVAKAVSDGRHKDEGGDWGMQSVTDFPLFIVEAANKMQPGEISKPVESEFGFHILKLIEVVPGEEVPLDRAEKDIQAMLRSRKGAQAIRDFTSAVTGDPNALQVFLDLDNQILGSPELRKRFSENTPPVK
jgi:parvulin-like peptidyl-prolyl isomerase